jgi:hypothetical protein
MSTRLTSTEGVVALFDSTSGVAFGEVFPDEDTAEDFLQWLEWSAAEEHTYEMGTRTIYADARDYTPNGLRGVRVKFAEDVAAWETAVDRSVSNPAQELGFMGWLKAGRP